MAADEAPRLTVGSLLGLPLGTIPQPGPPLPAPTPAPSTAPAPSIEGPGWTVSAGEVAPGTAGGGLIYRPDGVEALTYSNPYGQVMERVWFDGKVVYAVDLGEVDVDPDRVKAAQEYQVVYAVELDPAGKTLAEPQLVPGQLNIYDSVPGMPIYSPIWQFNYVVVPRDYTPNALRSAADCLSSGYPVLRSQVFEN